MKKDNQIDSLSRGLSALAIALSVPALSYWLASPDQKKYFPTTIELQGHVSRCLEGKLHREMPIERMRSLIIECAEQGSGPGSFWEKYILIRKITEEYSLRFNPKVMPRSEPFLESSSPYRG